jgi:hypothetical protein
LGFDPNPAESAEVFLGALRKAGFTLEVAAYAMNMVASYVAGFVLQEQSLQTNAERFMEVPQGMVESVDPARFPNLAEWMSMPHPSRDEAFAAQTKLIVSGLRQELQQRLTDQHRGHRQ